MHGAFAFHCTQTSPLDPGLSKQLNTKAHQAAACPALPGHTGLPASLTPSAPAPWPSLRLLVILSAVPPQNLGACPARPDTLLASVLGCCFSSLRSYLSHLLGEAFSKPPAKKHTNIILQPISALYFFIALTII